MCTETSTFLSSDQLYAGVLHILTAFEVPIHLFGAYIIIVKTPDKMKSVRTSMLSLHLVGAFLDFYISFLTAPVLILPVCAGYPLGILGMLGVPTSVQTYIGISFLGVIASSVLLFFEERYHKLSNLQKSSESKSLARKAYAVIHYIIAMIFIFPCFVNIPDQETSKLTVREQVPCLPEELFTRAGFFILLTENREMYISIAFIVFVILPQAVFFILSIFWHLFTIKSQSPATNRLQRQLFFAMCLQVFIPFMVLTIPMTFCVSSVIFNYYNQAATNLAMSAISLHGILSTLTMLIVHAPYRQAVQEIFCDRSKFATMDNQQIWKTEHLITTNQVLLNNNEFGCSKEVIVYQTYRVMIDRFLKVDTKIYVIAAIPMTTQVFTICAFIAPNLGFLLAIVKNVIIINVGHA